MKTKYRIRKCALGWAVQAKHPEVLFWETIAVHRWHWLASLRLWFLRETHRN